MQWRVVLTTFTLIFLAEMGDKTQLVAITRVAETKAPWAVLAGSCLALCVVSALGVLGGTVLMRFIPREWLERIAAVAFIAIGLWMLVARD